MSNYLTYNPSLVLNPVVVFLEQDHFSLFFKKTCYSYDTEDT